MNHILDLLGQSLDDLGNLCQKAIEASFQKSGDDPQFISAKKLIKKKYNGFCLDGRNRLSQQNSFRNALIIGGTGTGKSATVLIPSLLSMKGSFVVHDPSGELHQKTAAHLQQQNYRIHQLNFAQPLVSTGYNPLSRVRSISEVNKISALIIRTAMGGKQGDTFWNSQGVSLLASLIQLVKYQAQSFHNLLNVKFMLKCLGIRPDIILKLAKQSQQQSLIAEIKAFLAYDEKVRAGVIATCQSALQLLKDPQIAAVTAYDNLHFAELRARPTAIFLQNPTADQAYYRVLSSIFIEQLIAFMLSRLPNKKEQPIFCLIDEASSLYLPSLSIAVANVRKYRCGILLALQDFSQLVDTYGRFEAETIRSNCFAKMYFGGQSLATARELEESLGKIRVKNKEGMEDIRPLIAKDEIRRLPKQKALLLCGHLNPMLLKLKPYFKSRKQRMASRLTYLNYQFKASRKEVQILPQLLAALETQYGTA